VNERIVIATRKSELALWQARHVAQLLRDLHPGLVVDLLPLVTRGDVILDRPLAQIGGKALFLKELERALLDGEADIAVHSMKDVPVDVADGLPVDVVLQRANPNDGLLGRTAPTLEELPPGAVVGTSSLRRQCQLASARPDLVLKDLRGNVNTRIAKLQAGEYDAIILACAGMERLGLQHLVTQELMPPSWLPAATQGTLGIQCRAGDTGIQALIAPLADATTTVRTGAERAVARHLQGSCQVPLAVYAEVSEKAARLTLWGLVGEPDGSRILNARAEGPVHSANDLARQVADDLLTQGADRIIQALG
jgi:hydroxymethylbilane synthase